MLRPCRLLCVGLMTMVAVAFIPCTEANELPFTADTQAALAVPAQDTAEPMWELRWGNPERHWFVTSDWQPSQATRVEGGYQMGRARLSLDVRHLNNADRGDQTELSLIARYRF
ncbi:hypothetical protein KUV89_15920 [Marinobacter hydrocarbonoclasticus]|nr:hypothetical protein [Marinobacter nauticus]